MITKNIAEVQAEVKSVEDLLSRTKYKIDYYQREYSWKQKHVFEFASDLKNKFLSEYSEDHERSSVATYSPYFLGTVIVSKEDETSFIVDGQQRLTTLTLLLIFLRRWEINLNNEDRIITDDLIRSKRFDSLTFNLDFDDFDKERDKCLTALLEGRPFDLRDQSESVVNLFERYHEIEDILSEDISDKMLPYFIEWLLVRVKFVRITAYSVNDAYGIFETMNDRGLSLSSADMLKGYLLSNVKNPGKRSDALKTWRRQIALLNECDEETDSECIKAWLRSKYALDIRQRKRGAIPKDFDLIGTEFHRWVHNNIKKIELKTDDDFYEIINSKFRFFSNQYIRLIDASFEKTPNLEHIRYVSQLGFTLQYMVLLSPIKPEDNEELVTNKLDLTAKFIEMLLVRRVWNARSISYNYMQYSMFVITKAIRNFDLNQLKKYFYEYFSNNDEIGSFEDNEWFGLKPNNRKFIHFILARITDYIERKSDMPSQYEEFFRKSADPYEIEHIWPNKEIHDEDYEINDKESFQDWRNSLGGLLLLPKSVNAGISDKPFEKKLPTYNSQNMLARSLHSDCYKDTPRFKRFVNNSELAFEPYSVFGPEELNSRFDLYCQIANEIWNPEDFLE